MHDKIFLQGLKVPCLIGIFEWERKKKQKVVIDLEFPANIKKAASRDRIKDAVDYKRISKRTIQFVSSSRYFLVETLAERLAKTLLKEFPIRTIKLRISKPGAIRGSEHVGVEIVRRKK